MLAMPESLSGRPNLVLDTTVLSNFAMIGQVFLLEHLYRQHACTALMVAEEIQRGLASGYAQLQIALDILSPLQPAGRLVAGFIVGICQRTSALHGADCLAWSR